MNFFSQARRLGRVETSLGPDNLVLLRFSGEDRLSDLFEYRVETLGARSDFDFDALLGTHTTVTIEAADGPVDFDGIVAETRWAGPAENGWRYDLTLRPWFWLAGKRRNQRIFHNKTVVQIIQEVLQSYSHLGTPHLKLALGNDYPELEYTVQYGESDLAFTCRLMERFGISYYFEHEAGNHVLVLSDDVLSHPAIGARPYYGIAQNKAVEGEHFWAWDPERRITTGAMRLTDFNFKTPVAAMEVNQAGDAEHAEGKIESYDYPGDYLNQGAGRTRVSQDTRAERGNDARIRAEGDCINLRPGTVVTLSGGDPVPGDGSDYVGLIAQYTFVSQAYGTTTELSEKPFRGRYTLMPATAPMVADKKTTRPIIHGPQTAMVVGDGEIDCDEYGRILVRFHWDLENAYSMRCRVSQNWASKGWGGMVIPRIGMEVVVEFLEGDPDKPLVTGCVYNGRNQVPYSLPEHKTRSTFKTDTHEGDGYNELRFEDKKDEEEVFMHAQKDHNTVILNDESHQIGHDRSKIVGNDQKEHIGRDKQIDVIRDHVETIGQDEKKTIYRNSERQVDKDSFDYVNNHRIEATYANHQEEVGAHHYMKVEGDSEVAVGQKLFQRAKVQVQHAKDKFVIGGPGGTIEINASGVIIRAPLIQLKGPVQVSSGSPDQIQSLESAVNEGLDLAEVCIRKLTDE